MKKYVRIDTHLFDSSHDSKTLGLNISYIPDNEYPDYEEEFSYNYRFLISFWLILGGIHIYISRRSSKYS